MAIDPSDHPSGPDRQENLRSRLRAETAALHGALEQQLDLLSPDLSPARYRSVVKALHGYHAVLEPGLAAAIEMLGSELPVHGRVALLERDLLALGLSPGDIAAAPRWTGPPAISDMAQLAGCLYVIEGASLGGKVIAAAVHRRLGLTPATGCAFFSDPGASGRWPALLRLLDRLALGEAARVVTSAADTFRTLGLWLAQQGALR